MQKAGARKCTTLHTLRHSFATHLLESGISLWYIQTLLGYANGEATETYTPIPNKGWEHIESPLDQLDFWR